VLPRVARHMTRAQRRKTLVCQPLSFSRLFCRFFTGWSPLNPRLISGLRLKVT